MRFRPDFSGANIMELWNLTDVIFTQNNQFRIHLNKIQ